MDHCPHSSKSEVPVSDDESHSKPLSRTSSAQSHATAATSCVLPDEGSGATPASPCPVSARSETSQSQTPARTEAQEDALLPDGEVEVNNVDRESRVTDPS